MNYYAHLDYSNGSYVHRLLYPARYCNEDLHSEGWDFELSMGDPLGKKDIYCLHQINKPKNFDYASLWQSQGSIWVWSIDDDFTTVPEWNPCRPTEEVLHSWYHSSSLADLIVASTPGLAKALKQPKKTVVAPNLMEVANYPTPAPADDDKVLRVLWSGSQTHLGDLEVIQDPIDKLLRKYQGRVEFYFIGMVPGKLARDWLNRGVYYQKGVPLSQYPNLLAQYRPHVFMAPLDDITFNQSKSAIRVYEGWCLSAATIASPVGEYNVVRDEVDGLLAADESQWYSQLDRLISDGDFRNSLAETGRRRVEQEFNWAVPSCREPWLRAFKEMERRVQLKRSE